MESIDKIHGTFERKIAESEKDKVVKILSDKMQNAVKFAVPLTVNVSCGKTWYEAK